MVIIRNPWTKEEVLQMDHVKFLNNLRESFPDFDPWIARLSIQTPRSWDRWYRLSELFDEKNYDKLAQANQRQVYPNEIVADCDEQKYQHNQIVAKRLNPGFITVPFYSGGKGIHMSYFFDDPKKVLFKLPSNNLKRWKNHILKKIDHHEFIELHSLDAQKLDKKVTIQLEFAFNRKEDAKKKVPLIPFGPQDPIPLNSLDYDELYNLVTQDEKIHIIVEPIRDYPPGKLRRCDFVDYCLNNILTDFRKRAVYYMAARFKRNNFSEEKAIKMLLEYREKQGKDYVMHPNYIHGIVKYVYNTEKNRGCSSLPEMMKDCSDSRLKSAIMKCKCRKRGNDQ